MTPPTTRSDDESAAAVGPSASREQGVTVDLTAVVVAVTGDDPRILVVRASEGSGDHPGDAPRDALPSGPLELYHRTLETGLRAWVEAQTQVRLGYVEQLYTFGDRDRSISGAAARRALSIGYLALAREAEPVQIVDAAWRGWYGYFPWEDWRRGRPAVIAPLIEQLRHWAAAGDAVKRWARVCIAFGLDGAAWNEELVLERYELLYEAGLVIEAHRDGAAVWAAPADVLPGAQSMPADHRRILATAIARLRGKIKYRPVVFELMPPTFTLLQLQRAVEALAGRRLHKQNFRRLVEREGLVEETGEVARDTGGRPAKLVRFRAVVLRERAAPGVRLGAPVGGGAT